MDFWAFCVVMVGVVALVIQGISSFWDSEPPPGEAEKTKVPQGRRAIGALNLVLAGFAATVAILMRYGGLVIAAPFGAVMVQGQETAWMLRLAIVAAGVAPPLCWHRIRMLVGWKSMLLPSLAAGALVGIWAAFQVIVLNPGEATGLHVYSFDVWWPPLAAWLAICAAGSVHALLVVMLDSGCVTFAAALVAGLAVFAVHFQDLPENPAIPGWLQSRAIWILLKHLSCAICAVVLVYEITIPGQNENDMTWKALLPRLRKRHFVIATAITLVVMLVPQYWPRLAAIAWIELLAPLFVGLLALMAIGYGVSSRELWKGLVRHLGRTVPQDGGIDRLIRLLIALAVPIIGYCLVDVLSWGFLRPWFALAMLFFFWLLLVEALAGGVLDSLPITRQKVKNAVGGVWGFLTSVSTATAGAGGWLASAFARADKWAKAAIAVISPLIVLSLIVVLNEVQNYQSIVVHPFDWTGPGDDTKDGPDKDLGKILANGLINELGLLKRDLRSDLLVAQRPVPGESGRIMRPLSAAASDTYVDTAVAKSDDVTIAGVKIPLGFFVRPIQNLVDAFLRIRVVSGSVRKAPELDGKLAQAPAPAPAAAGDQAKAQKEQLQQYVVLLNSSDGGSWKERIDAAPPQANANPPACPTIPDSYIDPVDDLIQTLAFDVASADPAFIAAGMTKNRDAFRAFRTGVVYLNRLDVEHDPAGAEIDLKQAIECFIESEKHDRTFAPAEYRLGVALQRQWQPGAALAQFRTTLQASPGFTPAALLEAQTEYDFATYWYRQTAMMPRFSAPPGLRAQAVDIWTQIIRAPASQATIAEKRAAYAGLCQYELDARNASNKPLSSYVPYYFCSRAEKLYDQLAPSVAQDDDERSREALVLDRLGSSLEGHRNQVVFAAQPGSRWSCTHWPMGPAANPQAIRATRAALDYYRAAVLLMPTDAGFQCDAATAAARLGDHNAMERLNEQAGAHLNLADNLFFDGNNSTLRSDSSPAPPAQAIGLMNTALNEYRAAIERDPSRIEALIGFAYTAWQWQADWIQFWSQDPNAGPPVSELYAAENYARAALNLAIAHRGVEDQWNARTTLGEVLFANGRSAEAMDELQSIVEKSWVGQAEARWDLIGAKICAAREAKANSAALYSDATALLQRLGTDDQTPELPSLWTTRNVWDRIVNMTCPRSPTQLDTEAAYHLEKTTYGTSKWCDWGMVVAEIDQPKNETADLELQIWGGGVNETRPADGTSAVLLETPASMEAGRYFAQLVGPGHTVGSEIVSFQLKKGCSEGLVKLVFKKGPAAAGTPKPAARKRK